MFAPTDHVAPDPDVVSTELEEGQTVLLHLTTKLYFSLNPSGTCVWEGIQSGLTIDEIGRRLHGRFDVSPEHADRSVRRLLEQLVGQGLVHVRDGAAEPAAAPGA